MKSFLLVSLFLLMNVSSSFANDELKLDAACSYQCNYEVEMCYDGCWPITKTVKKYVNFVDKSLEEIDALKESLPVNETCSQSLPTRGQWEYKVQYTSASNFNCQFFKH